MEKKELIFYPENPVTRFLFNDTRSAAIWLVVRIYVGWIWLQSGIHKVFDDAWTGKNAGAAVSGYLQGAIEKASTTNDVMGWYAAFLEHICLPNATIFSYLVAFGEVLVGIGLIIGLFTAIAAFFGSMMNIAFLFAGTLSSNPRLLLLSILLMLAWKVAGWYGLDRWVLLKLGTPWGKIAKRKEDTTVFNA
ncbi:DoxX family protein [Ureibacillus sp. FSL K6-2830]|jgi:thiosulfate dehydrogenase [quinone] large subunit|uniref:DoxX family protein n=1 Tax=Ureibacillus sp. FSL K6-2830 TaxID=2954610 RepID=UPI0030F83FA1